MLNPLMDGFSLNIVTSRIGWSVRGGRGESNRESAGEVTIIQVLK